VEALAGKLAWATHHPDECAAIGRLARQRAETFRWETVLDRYDHIFRRIRNPDAR